MISIYKKGWIIFDIILSFTFISLKFVQAVISKEYLQIFTLLGFLYAVSRNYARNESTTQPIFIQKPSQSEKGNNDEREKGLPSFYITIKKDDRESALKVCFNPKYQSYLQEYFYLSFKTHPPSNCTLKSQVHQLMKEIETYAKIFHRSEFTGLIVSNKKFAVRLESYANHTLSIWYERPNKYRVQVTTYSNGIKKNETRGYQFDFDKEGNRTFYPQNGHNKPELFVSLINNFFTQAKEDLP